MSAATCGLSFTTDANGVFCLLEVKSAPETTCTYRENTERERQREELFSADHCSSVKINLTPVCRNKSLRSTCDQQLPTDTEWDVFGSGLLSPFFFLLLLLLLLYSTVLNSEDRRVFS